MGMEKHGRVSLVAVLLVFGLVRGIQSAKIWTITVGHDWGAQEYIDDEGYLAGFSHDLIAEVCAAANIECRTVWDKYSNCWDSEVGQRSRGGEGLLAGWYDACTGWAATIDRMAVFDFSMPFFPAPKIYFYIKKGASFDPKDVTGKTIGFQDGYMSDEYCLARQDGIKGPPQKAIHYPVPADMVKALVDGEIDAFFLVDFATKDHPDVEMLEGESYSCAQYGQAMMTRKDNEFNSHWNRGFQQLVASGRFRKLCEEAKEKHGGVREVSPCI